MRRPLRILFLQKLSESNPVIQGIPSKQASILFPTLIVGWGNKTTMINDLVKKIDIAIGSATNNKYNFEKLYNNNFAQGVDSEFSSPIKELISLARVVYQEIFNNKFPFYAILINDEMRRKIKLIQTLVVPPLDKLKTNNESLGPAVKNNLTSILNLIPTL